MVWIRAWMAADGETMGGGLTLPTCAQLAVFFPCQGPGFYMWVVDIGTMCGLRACIETEIMGVEGAWVREEATWGAS